MTILVTGAAGFVGLNVVKHLLSAGRPVVGFDRLPLPASARHHFITLPGSLTYIRGVIDRAADLEVCFAASPISAVIHCAVITAAAAREKTDPETVVAVNIQAATAALTAAARHHVSRFVYPSSGAVYGLAAREAQVLDEDNLVPQPANLYAATKWAAEIVLASIARSQGISFVAARLGSVFGPWEYPTGVRDTLSPMLQAATLLQRGEPAIIAPAHAADYIYSRDVAAGLVGLAEAASLPRTLYNLGTGRTATALHWCEQLRITHPEFRWRTAAAGETANVITHTAFDRPPMAIAHITRDIGFKPRFDFAAAAADYFPLSAEE